MKPKRYPYSGNKKQPHEEIAELKKQIAVNKSMITWSFWKISTKVIPIDKYRKDQTQVVKCQLFL